MGGENCLVGLIPSGHGEHCAPSLPLFLCFWRQFSSFTFSLPFSGRKTKAKLFPLACPTSKARISKPLATLAAFHTHSHYFPCHYWSMDQKKALPAPQDGLGLVEGQVCCWLTASQFADFTDSCWDSWYYGSMLKIKQLLVFMHDKVALQE